MGDIRLSGRASKARHPESGNRASRRFISIVTCIQSGLIKPRHPECAHQRFAPAHFVGDIKLNNFEKNLVTLNQVTIAARRFISSVTSIWDEKSIKYRHTEPRPRPGSESEAHPHHVETLHATSLHDGGGGG
jgi:hypothetical protein